MKAWARLIFGRLEPINCQTCTEIGGTKKVQQSSTKRECKSADSYGRPLLSKWIYGLSLENAAEEICVCGARANW